MTRRIWCALGLLLACEGTETGNPFQDSGESSYCEAVSTTELTLSQRGALGFAAEDVLSFARGPRSETLQWQSLRAGSYGPESGQGTLALTLTPVANKARLVDYEQRQGGGEEVGAECPDQLEIDVDLRLVSGGGALDETVRTVLAARSAEVASAYARVDPAKLQGTLTADSGLGADWRWEGLQVQLQATRYGFSGSLTPSFEKRSQDAVSNSAGSGPMATFGLAPCPAGTAVPLDVAAAPLLTLLTQHASADVNATTAAISFEPAGSACLLTSADLAHDGPGLMVLGTLTFVTADGVIDARWPVELRSNQDGTGPVNVVLDYRARLPEGTLEQRYGLRVETAGYDYGSAELKLTLATGGWSGAILAYGYKSPQCPTSTPDGQGSPGCPGAERSELARFDVR
ncbi:MAG: hypothetical protein ABW352_00420 [Polyangiales bacterium]